MHEQVDIVVINIVQAYIHSFCARVRWCKGVWGIPLQM